MTSILHGFTDSEIARIKAAGTEVTLPEGWSPISERTPADKAYIIVEGEVSVRKGGREIARLGAGEIIGEAAIVNHTLRTASIVAVTPLKLIHYTAEAVEQLIEEIPAFGEALRSAHAERTDES